MRGEGGDSGVLERSLNRSSRSRNVLKVTDARETGTKNSPLAFRLELKLGNSGLKFSFTCPTGCRSRPNSGALEAQL